MSLGKSNNCCLDQRASREEMWGSQPAVCRFSTIFLPTIYFIIGSDGHWVTEVLIGSKSYLVQTIWHKMQIYFPDFTHTKKMINRCLTSILYHFSSTMCSSFTKLRFRRTFWSASRVKILIGTKVMTQNAKMQEMQMSVFVQNCQKSEMEIFALCVITFEPIRI